MATEKQRNGWRTFLCVYDYQTGGIWFLIDATSREEVETKLPGIKVFSENPPWMTKEMRAEYDERIENANFHWSIDSPTGWLKDYLDKPEER